MKARGDFETAKEMFGRALAIDGECRYARDELDKLNAFTEPQTAVALEDWIVDLSVRKAELDAPKHRDDCGCNIV